jgi:hypothetical protein
MADNTEGAPSSTELAQLRADVADLKAALAKLADASTPAAKRDAREDVDDAEADLAKTARKLGLPVERYKAAVAAARRQAFEDEYSEVIDARVDAAMQRLLDEGDEGEGDGAGDESGTSDDEPGGSAKGKRKPKAAGADDDQGDDAGEKPKPKPANEDTDPVVPHWSERPLGELIR